MSHELGDNIGFQAAAFLNKMKIKFEGITSPVRRSFWDNKQIFIAIL
jgi:hypothetical protein